MNAIDPTLPEPVRRFLATGERLESITLDDEGNWSHEGEPFENDKLKQLFHRSITRTEGGTWLLSIPPFSYPIRVADTPFHVRRIEISDGPEPAVMLHLSDGSEEPLDPNTLTYAAGRGFYCKVKEGRFEARFNRPAYYALAERVEPPADAAEASDRSQRSPVSDDAPTSGAALPMLVLGSTRYAIEVRASASPG